MVINQWHFDNENKVTAVGLVRNTHILSNVKFGKFTEIKFSQVGYLTYAFFY